MYNTGSTHISDGFVTIKLQVVVPVFGTILIGDSQSILSVTL